MSYDKESMRVLIIAESANPNLTSGPLIGWNHSLAISKVADVHLVTQIRNESAISATGELNENVTYINSERVAARAWKLANKLRGGRGRGWTVVTFFEVVSYFYFETLLWAKFKDQLRGGRFDLVHRITPISPIAPSPIAGKLFKTGVPFVIGPLNGGLAWPKGFQSVLRAENDYLSYIRGMSRFLPGSTKTLRYASAVIAGSSDVYEKTTSRYENKTIYIPENGFNSGYFPRIEHRRQYKLPLHVLFVGRLVPYKGADILIEAAAPLIVEGKIRLTIVGGGPQYVTLMKQIGRLGISSGVKMIGEVSHQDVRKYLQNAHLLALPSIREFGGAIVIEAMAMGVVPAAVDYGGPADLVAPNSGFLIALGPRESIVERYRDLLTTLVDDPSVLRGRSANCVDRAHTYFSWEKKACQILEVYRWVLGVRSTKPDFGVPFPDLN